MQKSITINGVKLTAKAIRKSPQSEAVGGHSIAETKAGEIHWADWDGETHIFNAGAVQRYALFGEKIAFLA